MKVTMYLMFIYWLNGVLFASPAQTSINATFTASIYALPNTAKVRIIVFNPFNQRIRIEVNQGTHALLYQDIVGRRTKQYNTVYNFEDLPIGIYYIVISCGHQTSTRTLYLDPPYARPFAPSNVLSIDKSSW